MGCDNCDRLRREVRELKEELAEHERSYSGENPILTDIQRRFRIRPQTARIMWSILSRAGMMVDNQTLIEESGYEGTSASYDDSKAHAVIRVNTRYIRDALLDAGIDGSALETYYGRGRMISKKNAERIRALL